MRISGQGASNGTKRSEGHDWARTRVGARAVRAVLEQHGYNARVDEYAVLHGGAIEVRTVELVHRDPVYIDDTLRVLCVDAMVLLRAQQRTSVARLITPRTHAPIVWHTPVRTACVPCAAHSILT